MESRVHRVLIFVFIIYCFLFFLDRGLGVQALRFRVSGSGVNL